MSAICRPRLSHCVENWNNRYIQGKLKIFLSSSWTKKSPKYCKRCADFCRWCEVVSFRKPLKSVPVWDGWSVTNSGSGRKKHLCETTGLDQSCGSGKRTELLSHFCFSLFFKGHWMQHLLAKSVSPLWISWGSGTHGNLIYVEVKQQGQEMNC